jgi:hypothetical protein
MKPVSAFKKWTLYTDIQNLVRMHERKEKQMKLANLEKYQIQIFEGKIHVYQVKKVKIIQ